MKYICKECRTPCKLNANDCDFPPENCPFDGPTKPKWKLKKEKEAKPDGNLDK